MQPLTDRAHDDPRKKLKRPAAFLACLLFGALLSGCGDNSPTGPGSSSWAGTGTQTLLVAGEVNGSDVGGGLFVTDFAVSVSDTALFPVSGATVTIRTPAGVITLTESPPAPGTYTVNRSDYRSGMYTLSVTRGTDQVSGVTVYAPDIHTITSPEASDTLAKDQPFDVTWTRGIVAQEATVETRDYQSPAPQPDMGRITVPASGNPPRDDQRIRVWRTNRQAAAGGLIGSEFTAKIRNSVEPIVAQ